jgi:hypothetical protein
VGTRRVGVVSSFLEISRLVMLCGFLVVTSRVRMMLGCTLVVLGCFLRHSFLQVENCKNYRRKRSKQFSVPDVTKSSLIV